MQTAEQTMQKSPKFKKIEDIVKPDATMRLHQRLFDRRRKHHIEVQEDTGPGTSLSAYLISPKFRRTRRPPKEQGTKLATTMPRPVLQYSQITRQLPEESYLEHQPGHARSFSDRIAQRYRVFMSRHKPFYYSLTNGAASGWLQNPRASVALAGSALALLLFFAGKPYTPPTGPDNPGGKNPIVIQDTSRSTEASAPQQSNTTASTNAQNPSSAGAQAPPTSQAQPSPTVATPQTQAAPSIALPANGGGYGSGPVSTAPSSPTSNQTNTSTTTSTNLIQDIVKPTPVTVPGQDIKVDDKRVLQTSDTTITIN